MPISTKLLFAFVIALVCLALIGACTVVKIEEDEGDGEDQYATWLKTGTGFQADEYVEAVWDERILPVYEGESVDYIEVISGLRADREGAIEKYGLARETGEPFYVFKVRGTCRVVEYDDSSRNGVIRVDMEPADGEPRRQAGDIGDNRARLRRVESPGRTDRRGRGEIG